MRARLRPGRSAGNRPEIPVAPALPGGPVRLAARVRRLAGRRGRQGCLLQRAVGSPRQGSLDEGCRRVGAQRPSAVADGQQGIPAESTPDRPEVQPTGRNRRAQLQAGQESVSAEVGRCRPGPTRPADEGAPKARRQRRVIHRCAGWACIIPWCGYAGRSAANRRSVGGRATYPRPKARHMDGLPDPPQHAGEAPGLARKPRIGRETHWTWVDNRTICSINYLVRWGELDV